AERGGLRVVLARSTFADVGVLQNVQALGVGRHEAVFDPVVDHFHEVTGPGGTAVQVPVLGGAGAAFAGGGARDAAAPGRQRREHRVEALHHVGLAPDHQAVAALGAPDAPAR